MLIGGRENGHTTTVLPMTDEASCTRTFPEGSMFRDVAGLAAAMYNNREVMVCGGYLSGTGLLKSCLSLDVYNDTEEWEVAPSLPKVLQYHTMTTIGDSGAVAVTGGYTGRSLDKHI